MVINKWKRALSSKDAKITTWAYPVEFSLLHRGDETYTDVAWDSTSRRSNIPLHAYLIQLPRYMFRKRTSLKKKFRAKS